MENVLETSENCNAVFEHGNELPSLTAFFDPQPESLGTAIPKMFAAALSHKLKHPRIQLRTAADATVILKLAGSRSKWPGSVHITIETDYHEFTYCGSISSDGRLYPKAGMMTDDVRELLVRMSADPIAVVMELAKVSGFCAFCHRSLSDDRSVCHGYGERCAEVWGLRWDAPRAYHGLFGDVWSAVSGAELVGA